MTYSLINNFKFEWIVINDEGACLKNGFDVLNMTVFTAGKAEERAKEYVAWLNGANGPPLNLVCEYKIHHVYHKDCKGVTDKWLVYNVRKLNEPLYLTHFMRTDAEKRAREYLKWLNGEPNALLPTN